MSNLLVQQNYLSEETVDHLCTPEEFFQNAAEFV